MPAPPSVTEEKQEWASSQSEISRSLNFGEINPVLTCLWVFTAGFYLQLADGMLSKPTASLFCCAHGEAPHCHLWGDWHHRDFFGTSPSSPVLSSASGAVRTVFISSPLLLLLKHLHSSASVSLCTDWIYFLQISVLSLAAAFANLFTVWCPSNNVLLLSCLKGLNGTSKEAILSVAGLSAMQILE